jgi:hypothetical protein
LSGSSIRPRDFWSRRRAGVAAEAQLDEDLATARLAAAREAELAERSDEDILAELDLPEPEALQDPDQVRDFLDSTVPQRLKTRALRRLWRLNPLLANVDGLVDYGEDYTDAAMVIENMQTAYQVGKGMLTAFVEDEDQTADGAGADDDAPEEEPADDAMEASTEEADQPPVAAATPDLRPEPEPTQVAMPQRRMRFAFDSA